MNVKNRSNFAIKNQSTLYIMCGIPGSGKSTWAKDFKEKINAAGYYCVIVSRDEIRFKILEERGGRYFDYEKEVFKIYCQKIQEYLDRGYHVIADATQINPYSRSNLLDNLEIDENTIICCVDIDTPYSVCKERNSKREGIKRVPDSVIKRMSLQKVTPTRYEYNGFNYDGIITVGFSEDEGEKIYE